MRIVIVAFVLVTIVQLLFPPVRVKSAFSMYELRDVVEYSNNYHAELAVEYTYMSLFQVSKSRSHIEIEYGRLLLQICVTWLTGIAIYIGFDKRIAFESGGE